MIFMVLDQWLVQYSPTRAKDGAAERNRTSRAPVLINQSDDVDLIGFRVDVPVYFTVWKYGVYEPVARF